MSCWCHMLFVGPTQHCHLLHNTVVVEFRRIHNIDPFHSILSFHHHFYRARSRLLIIGHRALSSGEDPTFVQHGFSPAFRLGQSFLAKTFLSTLLKGQAHF